MVYTIIYEGGLNSASRQALSRDGSASATGLRRSGVGAAPSVIRARGLAAEWQVSGAADVGNSLSERGFARWAWHRAAFCEPGGGALVRSSQHSASSLWVLAGSILVRAIGWSPRTLPGRYRLFVAREFAFLLWKRRTVSILHERCLAISPSTRPGRMSPGRSAATAYLGAVDSSGSCPTPISYSGAAFIDGRNRDFDQVVPRLDWLTTIAELGDARDVERSLRIRRPAWDAETAWATGPCRVPDRSSEAKYGGGVTSAQATEIAVSSIGPDSTAVALASHTPSGGHGRPGGLKHPRSGWLVWAGTAAYSRPVFDGPNDRLSHDHLNSVPYTAIQKW